MSRAGRRGTPAFPSTILCLLTLAASSCSLSSLSSCNFAPIDATKPARADTFPCVELSLPTAAKDLQQMREAEAVKGYQRRMISSSLSCITCGKGTVPSDWHPQEWT